MNIQCLVFSILFMIAGVAFLLGKGIDFIKGFNEMSEAEKKEIDLKKLTRLMACVFLSAGLVFGLAGFHQAFLQSAFKWCMLAWFVLTGLAVYLISQKRYLHIQQ